MLGAKLSGRNEMDNYPESAISASCGGPLSLPSPRVENVSADKGKTCRFLSHVMFIEFVRGKLENAHKVNFLNGRVSANSFYSTIKLTSQTNVRNECQ